MTYEIAAYIISVTKLFPLGKGHLGTWKGTRKWKDNTKYILKKYNTRAWTGLVWFKQDSYEHGREPSAAIKG
jgi:hypothetical protein